MPITNTCVFCGDKKPLRCGRPSLFCSIHCRDLHSKQNKPTRFCKQCNQQFNGLTSSKYCSKKCLNDFSRITKRAKRRKSLRQMGRQLSGDKLVCALATCSKEFIARYSHQRFCQESCRHAYGGRDAISRGEVEASRIYFGRCKYCATWKATRQKTMINRLSCSSCQKLRTKENDTKKNHMRRAAGVLSMTVESLAKRDGTKCNICSRSVDMSKTGLDPYGPTIDHLLPVSKGGTNDSFNLALAHRKCNTSRGNRGHAQLLLEMTDAWATA